MPHPRLHFRQMSTCPQLWVALNILQLAHLEFWHIHLHSNHLGIMQAKPHQCKFHIQAESSQKLPIMGPFKCSIKRRTGRIMSASEPASTPAAQEPRQKSIKASRQEPNPTGWMDEVRARGSGREAAKQSKHAGQPAAHLLLLAPLWSQCLYSSK